MSWARLDDALAFHEKIVEAGNAAVGVWVRMIAWSSQHLTDGVVPDKIARLVAGESRGALAALERSGLVVRRAMSPLDARGSPGTLTGFDRSQTDLRRSQSNPEGPGVYEIHDYLKYNPSRTETLEKREKERERKGKNSTRNPLGRESASASPVPSRSRPDPDPIDSDMDRVEFSDLEQVGFERFGQLGGAVVAKIRPYCPIASWEWEAILKTKGKSWGYVVTVLASIRDESAQTKPPTAGDRPLTRDEQHRDAERRKFMGET